jgi:hypothetical protein
VVFQSRNLLLANSYAIAVAIFSQADLRYNLSRYHSLMRDAAAIFFDKTLILSYDPAMSLTFEAGLYC